VQLWLASGETVEGTASGIADDGSLIVGVAGDVRAYASGEVVRLT
jgi:biotin-(acetyl-CoA carboxylase) ligase